MRLATSPDIVPNVDHKIDSQRIAMDGGLMDGFSEIWGCTRKDGYGCYTQYARDQIPNLAALAHKFALSDRTFEFDASPSWASHVELAAATLDGFNGENPSPNPNHKPHPGWGCDSERDAPWWDGSQYIMVPACFPDQDGNGPYRSSPVQYVPTIFDRLDEAGLSWNTYGGDGPGHVAKSSGYLWSVCTYFYECLGSERIAHFVANSQLVADAENGSLPNFSLVTPTEAQSQHNNFSMGDGDNWIGQLVSAIQTGPQWSSTAIFITYDDCGCLYDHVNPLQYDPGWGIRVPLVIISPYARPRYTDSTPTTLVSILAFAEHALGLAPLNSSDGNAYDYANSFNYRQAPLAPVRTVNRPIPRWERRWLASHRTNQDAT